jgi:FlaA1/EpsC-like NDP-sugar epimerase
MIWNRAARLFDVSVVSLMFLAALAISSGSFTWPSFAHVLFLRIKLINIFIFGGYLAFCSAVFSICGFYVTHRLGAWSRRIREIVLATILITGILLVLPLRMEFATTLFFVTYWLLLITALMLARLIGQQMLYYARSRGRNLRNIVIVGEETEAKALADRIEKEATLGYRVVRVINAKEA